RRRRRGAVCARRSGGDDGAAVAPPLERFASRASRRRAIVGAVELARCPRCRGSPPLAVGYGALREDVCARCRGRFLGADAVERVVVDENGVARETLRELLALFAGKERIE